ncbi:Sua5/YciO/YrdC/YwlC family protein [Auritidibacter ignavus]|uniref:L-threonylcarbamoyladenylate synthase n=1 Tax=Auritidibacter TaxID=1160973 RepID=UPI000D732883|nr:Sua5/YciO/YrdC/YwlC family protein [Auritidibacter ignavus]AXR74831.1 translation factor (SUA5) [Auritidibacter sp. NML130574]PXA78319.1 translation factor (SUA5) [Auritidibacter sp. NML100628]PXA80783.1 translation factor (SUA5) [Auritidibacter sp. NML120779]PXA81085.1 translation factor (SUA5) [Auritidibacter sp. NML120636]WGH81374.1 Sua5/YciO/YrdC/YwlC family protein [Auritidibacter ignavus]
MSEKAPMVHWDGELNSEGLALMRAGGKAIVSPTKVGYIVMTSDLGGLERKFDLKQRKRNKPAVVLCGSVDQITELAELNDEVEAFYRTHEEQDVLMGCILPWKHEAKRYIPAGAEELVIDGRGTSCFVMAFGKPGEQIARARWEEDGELVFASSANPSGQGNRGLVSGIGERIEQGVDLIIEADDYVASIQPDATVETRWEQGVMVSFVDDQGTLVPEQKGERDVTPAPMLIRKGVYLDQILRNLSDHFLSWDFRQGHYY